MSAQEQGSGGYVSVMQSPIPLPKGIPPEVAPDSPPQTATTAPQGEAGGEDDAGTTNTVTVLRPGEDEPVRVVFGGPDSEEQGASGLDDGDESLEARWKRERAERFRQAPRSTSGGTEVAVTGPVAPITPPETDFQQTGTLRTLDKMTGIATTFEISVEEVMQVDRLRIRLDACRAPEGGAQHGTMAFLKVWDMKRPEVEIFSGWMFAESPALSALDHPRYDLWVISCTTVSGEQSAGTE